MQTKKRSLSEDQKHNDIVMRNSGVSRKHTLLTYSDRALYVEDLKSKNGTFVKVGKKWQKIKDRRHITLPASLKVGSIVILVDTQQTADLPEKKKNFLTA